MTIHCFEQNGLGQAPFTYLYCVDTGRCSATCQHCGTGIRYKFFIRSADNQTFYVGSDCVMRSGDGGLINLVKREKNRMAKEKRDAKKAEIRLAREADRAIVKANKLQAWISANAPLQPILAWAEKSSGISKNLFDNLQHWGTLTEKQVELLTKLYNEAQNPAPKCDCPVGKVEIEGKVVRFKWAETQYGEVKKMFVESPLGYKVYGTVPGNLNNVAEGDTVRFNATVSASGNDPTFGFYNRPTHAQIV